MLLVHQNLTRLGGHARESYRTFGDEKAVSELAERVMMEVLREVIEPAPIT